MSRITLFLSLYSCMFISSLSSMEHPIEKIQKNHRYLPIPDFDKIFSITNEETPSPKSPRNNIVTITTTPSISITNNAPHSTQKVIPQSSKFSDTTRSKSELSRSKTDPSSSTKHNIVKLFSKSDSAVENSSHHENTSLNKKKKSSSPSRIISISPRGKSKSPRNDLKLINAVLEENLDDIKAIINDPEADLNQTDEYGNNALHRALLSKNKEFSKETSVLLLSDHRFDSSLTNQHGNTAQQLLLGGENAEIRIPIFGRTSLDIKINEEKSKLLSRYTDLVIGNDEKTILQIAEKIQADLDQTALKQTNSTPLPKEAIIPSYATKEFIAKIIKYRMPEIKILKNLINKEASVLLLNIFVENNDDAIAKAAFNVQNEISKIKLFQKSNLTPPTNHDISYMIRQYIQHKKSETSSILMWTPESTSLLRNTY